MARQHTHIEQKPFLQSFTKWHNPTDRTIRMELFHSTQRGFQLVEIAPGATVEIDSMLDNGVQQVRDGVIQAGKGVQLKRMGTVCNGAFEAAQMVPVLHEVLDPDKQAAKRQALAEEAVIRAQAAAGIAAHELVSDTRKPRKAS